MREAEAENVEFADDSGGAAPRVRPASCASRCRPAPARRTGCATRRRNPTTRDAPADHDLRVRDRSCQVRRTFKRSFGDVQRISAPAARHAMKSLHEDRDARRGMDAGFESDSGSAPRSRVFGDTPAARVRRRCDGSMDRDARPDAGDRR